MNNRRNIQLKLISYGVIAYMTLAFGWWSVLLYTKNQDALHAKQELMVIAKMAAGEAATVEQAKSHPDYMGLEKDYKMQEKMITGEVLVFVFFMAIGLWLIHSGYNKAIQAAEQRRNFLLSITHELKSPIASIKLVLETFKKRKLTEKQQQQLVQNALTETDRLHVLVNNLLLSARLESTYKPNQEMVDFPVLLEEMVDLVQTKNPQAQIQMEVGQDIPYVLGDRIEMSSVILNLLENAIKYSPAPAQVDVQLTREKNNLILEIADQGIGIPDREKRNIFEKFYRVGSEDTRRTKGTGLGLYIVEKIILAHRGTIKVLDNHPKGSIFRVSLPAKQKVIANDEQLAREIVDV